MVRVVNTLPQRDERGTYKSLFLQHPEDKINDDVVFGVENLDNSLGNPSVWGSQGQFVDVTGGPEGGTYCFITSRFTFCMSTFLEYSRGNLVLLRSFASTPLAMAMV